MPGRIKRALLKLLKVPADPETPAGSPGSVRTFRAATNYFKLRLGLWAIRQAAAVIGIVVFLTFWHRAAGGVSRDIWIGVNIFEAIGIGMFLIQLPFTFAMVRLDYEMRWYIVTDRSLRIRAGIWQVREMTMTFANIQQIAVHQGPLQRLLGIFDLEVSTAGGGEAASHGHRGAAMAESPHRGFFSGIDNAPAIRDMMLERLRRVRDTGLGNPDEPAEDHSADVPPAPELLEAARELLREAAALRRSAA